MPIAFTLKIPMLIPIVYGLTGGPLCAVPIAFGTIACYMVTYVKAYETTIKGAGDSEMFAQLTAFAQQLFNNKEMWTAIIAFVICLLVVYSVRKLSVDNAWKIAIVSGALVYVIVVVIGRVTMHVDVPYVAVIIGTIVSILLALVLEFFAFAVDYSRTENLQFEDDEYFYYVKAVPKASVATSERSIKKINAEPVREERKAEDNSGTYANPIFRQDEKPKRKKASPAADRKPRQAEKPAAKDIDFEKKLEESLKIFKVTAWQ